MHIHTISQKVEPANTLSKIALDARGISFETAALFGLQPRRHGWIYPVSPNADPVRFKAYDSSAFPKYRWLPTRPADATFYDPTGQLHTAIAHAHHTLILAAGEPDVWVLGECGLLHATCTLHGEGTIPGWLVDELRRLEVQTVRLWPDRDAAGLTHARKVAAALAGSGITVEIYVLPYAEDSKADLNTLWLDCGQDRDRFIATLEACPVLDIPNQEPPQPAQRTEYTPPAEITTLYEQWCLEVERAAVTAWQIAPPNGKSWSRRNFSSPLRDDHHPSAGWNYALHGFKDFATGDFYSTPQTAALLGVPAWDDYKRDHAPQNPPARARQKLEDTIQPVTLPTLTAHQRVNVPYISDLPTRTVLDQRAVLITSPLGTGKTEYMQRMITDLGPAANVLVITHRQALAANIAERLALENYKTIPDPMLPQASRLVISYDSLHKIGTARRWDVVIIDEIEQFHRHLFGGTFKGGEAYRAHRALVAVIGQSEHVIGLDAHLTDISAQWLHAAANSAPYVIVNEHQPDRGELTLYQHESALIAAVIKAITQQPLPVVITVAHRQRAETIYRYLVDTVGPDRGLLVTGDTSSSRDVQQFVKGINGPDGIASLRFLVCTSSFGTGLDVTTPVYAVFGVFHNQPLLPGDMLQMLMRYRHADRRAAYVQHLHARDPRDWLDVVGEAIDARADTRIAADFAAHHVPPVSADQHTILRLAGKLTTAANVQKTDLVSYFAAFARSEGFTLAFNNARHNPTRRALSDTADRIAEDTARRVLAAEPVRADQYTQHQLTGTTTPDVIAGYKRWTIETTSGLEITRPIYDDLHTPRARAALRRLADVLDDPETLKARDRQEDFDQVLLSNRGHYTTRCALVCEGLTLVFGPDFLSSAREITTADLDTCGFVAWCETHLTHIQRLVDRRDDLSTQPLFVLRRLLATLGLTLDKRQVMRDGERFMVYWLAADHRERWLGYARARLVALATQNGITTNAERPESFRDRSNRTGKSPPLDLDLLDALSAMYRDSQKQPLSTA